MTTYYCSSSVKPGDQIHYSDMDNQRSEYYDRTQAITPIDLACYSDYSGTDVERSNRRVMLADSEIEPHLVRLVGSHGSEGVAYLGEFDDLPEALRDAIGALDSYPLLDESDCSEMEMEMEYEAWDSYGRSDFRRALVRVLDALDAEYEHDDCDAIEDDALFTLWRDGCDTYNVNGGSGFAVESGGGVYFYVDEWCKRATENEDSRYPWSDWGRNARAGLRERLTKHAIECRATEGV